MQNDLLFIKIFLQILMSYLSKKVPKD